MARHVTLRIEADGIIFQMDSHRMAHIGEVMAGAGQWISCLGGPMIARDSLIEIKYRVDECTSDCPE